MMPYRLLKSRLTSAAPAALLVIGAALAHAPAAHADTGTAARPAPVYTGNYIVRWRDGSQTVDTPADTTRMRQVASSTGLGLSVKRPMSGAMQLLTVKDSRGDDPEIVAKRLRNDPRIADAVPDRWLRLHDTIPNDPEFATNQTYLGPPSQVVGGVNLPKAWDRTRGSSSVVIAVVDTGYLPHPDLASRIIAGYNFVTSNGATRSSDATDPGDYVPSGVTCPDGSAGPEASTWHGTRVAGTLGALTNNGLGIAGVDWSARIQPVRVSGRCGALLSDTVDGMRWAGGLSVPNVPNNPTPARVINVSLGGGTCSTIEQQAINDLNAAGVVVVAAAGNSAGAVEAPADCSGVVAVTAHANDGENASYANFGTQVTLSAPGGGCGNSKVGTIAGQPVCTAVGGQSYIRTLSNDGATTIGNYTIVSSQGTSFATPMVSGVVALMFAVNGALTPAQVTTALQSSARPHPANTFCTTGSNVGKCGAGLLDADAALAAAIGTPASSTSTSTGSGGGGGGGGAMVPWSAALLLVIGVMGFAIRRRVGVKRA
ncbi:hypothetical protein HpMS107_02920 [Helicobacter pylori]